MRTLVGLLLYWSVSFAAGAASTQEPEEKTCRDCHSEFPKDLGGEHDHEPFSEELCHVCHENHDFGGRLELKGLVFNVCTDCHSKIIDIPEENIHSPLTDDESCVLCHTPHGADNKKLLRASPQELCTGCHEGPEDEAHPHPPYAEVQCLECHDPHGTFFSSNLKLPAGYVCQSCHSEILGSSTPEVMHAAKDEQSCEQCHTGHSSNRRALLKAVPPELCADCHDTQTDSFRGKHAGLNPTTCTGCHNPHASGGSSLIRAFEHSPFEDRECDVCHDGDHDLTALRDPDLCMNCHDAPEDQGAHSRDKIRNRVCTDCHSPHASDKPSLLALPRQ